MKKVLVFFVSLLSIVMVACQATTSVITTTQIPTTTTEYYNEYYYELSSRIEDLDVFNADFLDISMLTTTSSNINSQFTNIRLNTHIQIDNLNNYMYMANYEDSFNIDNYTYTYFKENEFVSYSVAADFLTTEDLESEFGSDNSIFQFADFSLVYDMLISESVHVDKRTDDTYYTVIPITRLLNEANSLYDGMIDLQSIEYIDLRDVFLEVFVVFIDEFSFSVSVNIDQISLNTGGVPISISVMLNQVYSIDQSTQREVLDLSNLKIVSSNIPGEDTFTFEDDLDNYLQFKSRSSNYFKVFLSPGTYSLSLDLEDSSFIEFIVSNDRFVFLSNQNNFEIIDEGYYYLNFANSSESELIIRTTLNKD